MFWRELAREISLTSLGSSQILPFPHLSTEAASRFWSFSDTCENQTGREISHTYQRFGNTIVHIGRRKGQAKNKRTAYRGLAINHCQSVSSEIHRVESQLTNTGRTDWRRLPYRTPIYLDKEQGGVMGLAKNSVVSPTAFQSTTPTTSTTCTACVRYHMGGSTAVVVGRLDLTQPQQACTFTTLARCYVPGASFSPN